MEKTYIVKIQDVYLKFYGGTAAEALAIAEADWNRAPADRQEDWKDAIGFTHHWSIEVY